MNKPIPPIAVLMIATLGLAGCASEPTPTIAPKTAPGGAVTAGVVDRPPPESASREEAGDATFWAAGGSRLFPTPGRKSLQPILGHASFASRLLKTKEWHPKIIHNSPLLWIP